KFIDAGDPLASAFRLGAAYRASEGVDLTLEGVSPKSGTPDLHAGVEWRMSELFAVRGGYQTQALKQLSGPAGVTLGLGLRLSRIGVDYAWVPMGDFGPSQFVSLNVAFGAVR